jgi:PBP1b-binding outer membrane lipoprotein LpoB
MKNLVIVLCSVLFLVGCSRRTPEVPGVKVDIAKIRAIVAVELAAATLLKSAILDQDDPNDPNLR